jgi:Tfp pilus assembly protein PilE
MRKSQGFSMFEIVIVFVIVVVLGVIAIPRYYNVLNRNRMKQVINQLQVTKDRVRRCFMWNKSFVPCRSGKEFIATEKQAKANPMIESITVKKGVIKVVPAPYRRVTTKDYVVFTPSVNGKRELKWKRSGPGLRWFSQ